LYPIDRNGEKYLSHYFIEGFDMSNSIINTLCLKIIPIAILVSVTSGCANSEQKYGQLLDARPMPAATAAVTEECSWIGQELAVIDQNILKIKTTKGIYAYYGPTAVVKEQRRITMLNSHAKSVGCTEEAES
jgi:hypothetical protein